MKTLILLAAVGLCSCLQAQNPIQHMDVFVQPHTEEVSTEPIVTYNTLSEPQMTLMLGDTANITSFQVRLGTTEGGNDLFEKTFTYSETGTFQDGTTYLRDRNYVRLYLGKYADLSTYYAQVKAVVNGTPQSAVTFSGQ